MQRLSMGVTKEMYLSLKEVCNLGRMLEFKARLDAKQSSAALKSSPQVPGLNEDQFTRAFKLLLQLRVPDVIVGKVAPLQVQFRLADGVELTAFLRNAYEQQRVNSHLLAAALESQLAVIKAQPTLASTGSVSEILPIIRPASFLETVRRQHAQTGSSGAGISLVSEALNDDLLVLFVFDSAEGMRFVSTQDLANLKLDMQALRVAAKANLSRHVVGKKFSNKLMEVASTARIYMVSGDENYESSALLLKDFWSRSSFNVKGNIVAFVPVRGLVLVTGSQDKEGLRLASQVAAQGFAELPYAISPAGFELRDGAWQKLNR